jgi:hypothetical protein
MEVLVKKSKILSAERYIAALPEGKQFRLAYRLDAPSNPILSKINLEPRDGSTVLPKGVGAISQFNSSGRWLVKKDQPKVPRLVRSMMWTWTEYHGRERIERSEECDDVRLCYPREWIPAPGVELTYVSGPPALIVGPQMRSNADAENGIRHAVNLFLELFGECEFIGADLETFVNVPIRRVNWKLLPPGDSPWTAYRRDLFKELSKRIGRDAEIMIVRQDAIKFYGPDEIFVGNGGFDDYLCYVFRARDLTILESVKSDNALYAFDLEWEKVSQLSKAQIINGGLSKARIIHATGWKARLSELMTKYRPKEKKTTQP